MRAGAGAGAGAIMARAFRAAASPFPSSKNATAGGGIANIQWLLKKCANRVQHGRQHGQEAEDDDEEGVAMFDVSTPSAADAVAGVEPSRKRGAALARLRSAILNVLARARRRRRRGSMGSSVTGTIFGRRRGRVHVALQTDPRAPPALMVELAAYSTDALVREMSSGLVRLALQCEKTPAHTGSERRRVALVEESTWRAYCNGRKCGYAVRRECGAEEWRVLRAVEPVSVGAGVLPDGGAGTAVEGNLMYMRARFERVVGSRDSEAFYMMNPDDNGAPELSIYLLRV